MQCGRLILWIHALLLIGVVGCRTVNGVSFVGDEDIQHYRDKMLGVEFPNVVLPTPPEVFLTKKPRTIRERSEDEIWEMSLTEAIHTALMNNKMIRTRTNNLQLLSNPNTSPSVYDPAIGETGYLFGNRGVEAALSDFDATFSASTQWGNNSTVQNSFRNFDLNEGTGSYTSSLSKTLANGGNLTVNHNWNYLNTNSSFVPIQSSYTGTLQAVYTQPLWSGGGADYVRTAGPVRPGFGAITGVSQGVSISRINSDIDVADFELAVSAMVKDVEDLYWELYLAYRQFDAEIANRESLHRSWVEVKSKMDSGGRGGSSAEEAQAREKYFDAASRAEDALSSIYSTENALRKLLGLPVNDGRIIRPKDDPVEAEFVVEWESSLLDALTHRVELRRQKWQIKSLELQVRAAENAANPQLNLVSAYQLNGFGTSLLAPGSNAPSPNNSVYSSLASGNLPGWYAGLQFSVPIGLRAARMQLHNIELQLIKAKVGLSSQEQDISHELADAVQRIDAAYARAQHQLNRKIAAFRRVEATRTMYAAGGRNESNQGVTLDLVMQALASNATAEIAYFTALIDYNKAITEFNRCRGMLLEEDGIHLSEAEWDQKSKSDALMRAAERTYAIPINGLEAKPAEFSPPIPYPRQDLFFSAPQPGSIGSQAVPTAPQDVNPTPTDLPK